MWHALLNDRNVRVEGCVKYSIARRVGSKSRSMRAPESVFASKRTRVANEQSSSSSGRSKTRGSMTWNREVRVGRTSVSLKGSVAIAVTSESGTARRATEIVRRNAGLVYRLEGSKINRYRFGVSPCVLDSS
jgi:hypothetical protein